jgi:hypothetical protein
MPMIFEGRGAMPHPRGPTRTKIPEGARCQLGTHRSFSRIVADFACGVVGVVDGELQTANFVTPAISRSLARLRFISMTRVTARLRHGRKGSLPVR